MNSRLEKILKKNKELTYKVINFVKKEYQKVLSFFKNNKDEMTILISIKIITGLVLFTIFFNFYSKLSKFIKKDRSMNILKVKNSSNKHISLIRIDGILDSTKNIRKLFNNDTMAKILDNDNLALIIEINSPGGVSTVPSLVESYINKIKLEKKPVVCVVKSKESKVAVAASAAYWIASFCEKIYTYGEFDLVGSIGGYQSTMFSFDKILKSMGFDFSNKMSNNSYISEDFIANGLLNQDMMKKHFTKLINTFYSAVSKSRNLTKAQENGAFNGKVFTAKQALELNLIDGILFTYDDLLNKNNFKENIMSIYLLQKYKIPFNVNVQELGDLSKSGKKNLHGLKNTTSILFLIKNINRPMLIEKNSLPNFWFYMYKIKESEELNNQEILKNIEILHEKRKKNENSYKIDTPPPGISGKLHIGHVFSYTQMDFIAKYKHLIGMNITYPIGYDDNGLPSEKLIEKLLKTKVGFSFNKTTEECLIENKIDTDIIKNTDNSYKLCTKELFIEIGSKIIEKYENEILNLYKKLNFSFNFKDQYRTISKNSEKIAHASFYDLYKKGLIYKKEGPVFWDPVDKTSLSKADIIEKDENSFMNYISFDLESSSEKIIIMTTRPEMLKACLAVFYNPNDERYNGKSNSKSYIDVDGNRISINANNLNGKFATTPFYGKKIPILPDHEVKMDKGTGLVMCCSYGDWQDVIWIKRHNLSSNLIMNDAGKVNVSKNSYEFKSISEAREEVIENIGENLILTSKISHSVKKGDRTDANVEILEKKQWFVAMKDFKNEFLNYSKNIQFFPEKMRIKLDSWIENLNQDWCISRNRYLGISIPKEGINEYESEDENLVLDTWFTSSSTPHLNYKGENVDFDDLICNERNSFDLRAQAHDIIRTWAFYTIAKDYLHKFCKKTDKKTEKFINETNSYIECLNFDKKSYPWKDIMISGWCLSKDKEKMSKSKGNAVDPLDLIEKHGSDCVRYWASCTNLGTDTAFEETYLKDASKIINKMSNITNFLSINKDKIKNTDQFLNLKISELLKNKEIHPIDTEFLSLFCSKIKYFFHFFDNYEYSKAREILEKFFWEDFCNDYIELTKVRSYGKDSFLFKDKNLSDNQIANLDNNQKSTLITSKIVLYYVARMFAIYMPSISSYVISSLTDNKMFVFDDSVIEKSLFFNNKIDFQDYLLIREEMKRVRKLKSENGVALNGKISKISFNSKIKDLNENMIDDLKTCLAAENAKISFSNEDLIEFF